MLDAESGPFSLIVALREAFARLWPLNMLSGQVLGLDCRSALGQLRIEHCPMGQEPVEQGMCGQDRRYARMDAKRCERCSWPGHCPARRSDRATAVTLTGSPSAGATSARRHRERTKEFKDGYRLRSGIEATNSEYKRPYGGGRLRVRGSPAVTRTVKFKFMALNIRRWTKPARKTQNQAA